MIDDVLLGTENRMNKSLDALKRELASIRTGRASPNIVEHVRVDYYGSPTPIQQIAGVSIPDSRTILIQPWDRAALGAIEKAILKSDLGLNPANDGSVIRLPVPPLTEERRKDLVKVVHSRVEEGRVALRNVRRDALEELRKLEKNKEVSADEEKRAQDKLQKLTDGFITEAEKIGKYKESELIES
ncbi:MAG: ribosome recycling factor [Dehalococcoidia bacterium]|nr:ribosome recycling factor [Dehalococcoidia bacterium]MDZ4246810.1 ribosome recycling factor [Dehalococcoidia bacterium]